MRNNYILKFITFGPHKVRAENHRALRSLHIVVSLTLHSVALRYNDSHFVPDCKKCMKGEEWLIKYTGNPLNTGAWEGGKDRWQVRRLVTVIRRFQPFLLTTNVTE